MATLTDFNMHQIHCVTATIEHQALPTGSGSLAIFTAMLRASSLLSSFAAEPSNDFSNQRLSPSHA